jgi:N-methylhydantoinase B
MVSPAADPILAEVVSASLSGVVQEMQNSLFCTGYSTIIRESRDASCAILDASGRVVAQFTVLPLHLGAFPACVEALREDYADDHLSEGDAFLVNHPYFGGSPHATDMAVLTPILVDGKLFGWAGSIAHKSDIGGLVPGTNSGQAREIFHEGILVPPIRFYAGARPSREIETILRANSRTPELVLGDLRGQVGATWLGAARVQELCAKYGAEQVAVSSEYLFHITEQRVRASVRAWPNGCYDGQAVLHNAGVENGRPVRVRVRATINDDRICFDFRESDNQTAGPYNIRPPLVRAVCYYAMKCLIDPELPSNQGLAAAIETEFRPGSLLCPEVPAPVNTYMPVAVCTAEAIFDALGQAVPHARIAESSSGANGTLAYAHGRRGYPQVQYELPAGAIGARSSRDGVSASKAHVANGGLTPVEIVESEYPVELVRFELIQDSGGAGRYRGGLAYLREYRLLGEATFTTRGGRQLTPPAGRAGGLPGRPARFVVNPGTPEERVLSAHDGTVRLRPGDLLRMEQAGGGGYGDPLTRPPELVLQDVREGYVSAEAARAEYGVAVIANGFGWSLDQPETQRLRASSPSR